MMKCMESVEGPWGKEWEETGWLGGHANLYVAAQTGGWGLEPCEASGIPHDGCGGCRGGYEVRDFCQARQNSEVCNISKKSQSCAASDTDMTALRRQPRAARGAAGAGGCGRACARAARRQQQEKKLATTPAGKARKKRATAPAGKSRKKRATTPESIGIELSGFHIRAPALFWGGGGERLAPRHARRAAEAAEAAQAAQAPAAVAAHFRYTLETPPCPSRQRSATNILGAAHRAVSRPVHMLIQSVVHSNTPFTEPFNGRHTGLCTARCMAS
eukprot:gene15209-biopygen1553